MLESLFNKVANLSPANLLKRDSRTGVSCQVCEIFGNTYFEESLRTTALEEIPLLEIFEI